MTAKKTEGKTSGDIPYSISAFFEQSGDRERKMVMEVREKMPAHLYPGLYSDQTTLKLLCIFFDTVTISELTATELGEIHQQLDGLEPDLEAAPIKRKVRMALRKSERFQEETQVLRDEGVLQPFGWEGGSACLFQPPSIGLAGDLIFLGRTEMNDLAQEIAGSDPLEKLDLFSTPFGLTCVREHYPKDIQGNPLAIAVAVSEIVGFVELFQMIPITSNRGWSHAFCTALSAHPESDATQAMTAATLGISILKQAIPNIELKSYDDVLEARLELRDELHAFRDFLREQVTKSRYNPYDPNDAEIKRSAKKVAQAVGDIEKKLSSSNKKFVKEIARNLVTASPPILVSHLVPELAPIIGNAIGAFFASWGIHDAIQDYIRSRAEITRSHNGISFLLKVRRRI